jgi:hypothetical protein
MEQKELLINNIIKKWKNDVFSLIYIKSYYADVLFDKNGYKYLLNEQAIKDLINIYFNPNPQLRTNENKDSFIFMDTQTQDDFILYIRRNIEPIYIEQMEDYYYCFINGVDIYTKFSKWYNDFKLEQKKLNTLIDDSKEESTTQQREEKKEYDEPKLFYNFKKSINIRGMLFDFLKQENYIKIEDNENTCIKNSFNYIFQIETKDRNINKFKKINWLGSKSLLVVLIGELSKAEFISSKNIWRTAIDCFRVNGEEIADTTQTEEEIQKSTQQLSNIYSLFNNPKNKREIKDSKKIIDFIKSQKI